ARMPRRTPSSARAPSAPRFTVAASAAGASNRNRIAERISVTLLVKRRDLNGRAIHCKIDRFYVIISVSYEPARPRARRVPRDRARAELLRRRRRAARHPARAVPAHPEPRARARAHALRARPQGPARHRRGPAPAALLRGQGPPRG